MCYDLCGISDARFFFGAPSALVNQGSAFIKTSYIFLHLNCLSFPLSPRRKKRSRVIGGRISVQSTWSFGKKLYGLLKHSLTSQLMDVLSAVSVSVSDAGVCKLKSACLDSTLCTLDAIEGACISIVLYFIWIFISHAVMDS